MTELKDYCFVAPKEIRMKTMINTKPLGERWSGDFIMDVSDYQ